MALFSQLQTHAGMRLALFCLLAFLSFYYLYNLSSRTSDPVKDGVFGFISPIKGHKHPIETLVDDARRRHTLIVESQSKSLSEAIANYRKRYSREPPPGFDDWYHAAVALNATIIDDYDSVMTMFEPYWGMSARELRARVREVLDSKSIGGKLPGIRVKDHEIETVHEGSADNRRQQCSRGIPNEEDDLFLI